MKRLIFAALTASLPLAACHHYQAPAPSASVIDEAAISNFAIAAVYDAHPTRALVEMVDVEPAAELGRYMVRVEMSGSEEFRKAYDLVVVEAPNGMMELISLEDAN